MNFFPSFAGEGKKLLLSQILAVLIVMIGASFSGLYIATQIGIGVLICLSSIGLYALLAWTIIVKKNVAWMGPLIVIKYLILISSIYYVWKHQNILLMLVGLMSQLIISIVILGLIKHFDKQVDK